MCGSRFYFLLLAACCLTACAQPKYEVAKDENGNSSQQHQSAADCSLRFQKSGYCLSWQWEKKPTSSEMGSLIFKIYRASSFDNTPIMIDATQMPNLLLWMPSMEHGSTPTNVTRLEVGTYRASNVFFIMPGEWEMKFQVKDGSTIQDEAVANITL